MFDTFGTAVEALFTARFRVEKLHAYFTKCQINRSASHIHHRFLLKQSAIILRAIKTSAKSWCRIQWCHQNTHIGLCFSSWCARDFPRIYDTLVKVYFWYPNLIYTSSIPSLLVHVQRNGHWSHIFWTILKVDIDSGSLVNNLQLSSSWSNRFITWFLILFNWEQWKPCL